MYFAGIDIGGSTVKIGVTDREGTLLYQTSVETILRAPEALADRIAAALSGYTLTAAGVCCAGRVRTIDRTVIAGNLGWHGVPFAEILEARLRCPVVIDNDVAGALTAEYRLGVCRGLKHVVYLTLGTGIGGAMLLDGRFYRGNDNAGGEIGHIITHAEGLPCSCGGHGCFEQYASAPALKRIAGGVEPREVFRRAEEGDPAMNAALDEYIHELCLGLISVLAVFRPEMIVLGGGISEAGAPLLRRVAEHLETLCPVFTNNPGVRIALARCGNTAGILGGAAMAIEAAFR